MALDSDGDFTINDVLSPLPTEFLRHTRWCSSYRPQGELILGSQRASSTRFRYMSHRRLCNLLGSDRCIPCMGAAVWIHPSGVVPRSVWRDLSGLKHLANVNPGERYPKDPKYS